MKKTICVLAMLTIIIGLIRVVSVWHPRQWERTEILRQSNKHNLDVNETCLVIAIRIHERGGKGYEYGVKKAKGTDYETQLSWAIHTIMANRARFNSNHNISPSDRHVSDGDFRQFISFLGSRYCPNPSPDDKRGINRFWIPFTTTYWETIKASGVVVEINGVIYHK